MAVLESIGYDPATMSGWAAAADAVVGRVTRVDRGAAVVLTDSGPVRATFGAVGLVSGRLSFALWYLMAMEESSTALARDMGRRPVTETLGPLEPTFAAVHRDHMRDEARHLQIDGILAERCLARAGRAARLVNARLFKSLLDTVTRPTRAGSGVKVIRQLVREMPELSWHEERMIAAVLALKDDRALQPSERVVPVLRADTIDRFGPGVVRALDEASAGLTTGSLRALNARVLAGESPEEVARSYLDGLPAAGLG